MQSNFELYMSHCSPDAVLYVVVFFLKLLTGVVSIETGGTPQEKIAHGSSQLHGSIGVRILAFHSGDVNKLFSACLLHHPGSCGG